MKQAVSLSKTFLVGNNAPGSAGYSTRTYQYMSCPSAGSDSRRIKPQTLSIKNGTAYTTTRQILGNEQCQYIYRQKTAPYALVTELYATQMAYPLGKFYDPLEFETLLLTSATNSARSKARGRSVNLANMLGEYRKTAKLFPELAEKVYRLTMAAYHRDPRILFYGYWYHRYQRYGGLRPDATKRSINNISAEWLRYIYGVKPLAKDLAESIEVLKKRQDWSPPPVRVDATKRSQTNSTQSVKDAWGRPCGVVQISQKSVKVIADINLSNIALNQSLGRFGFTNPLGVAWELLPFSFVVDWWANIGEFLESLDNVLYFDGSTSWAQSITRYKQTTLVSTAGGSGYGSFEQYARSAPFALGNVATPYLKLTPSALHIANSMALLVSLKRLKLRYA